MGCFVLDYEIAKKLKFDLRMVCMFGARLEPYSAQIKIKVKMKIIMQENIVRAAAVTKGSAVAGEDILGYISSDAIILLPNQVEELVRGLQDVAGTYLDCELA